MKQVIFFIAIAFLAPFCKKTPVNINDVIETKPPLLEKNVIQVNGSVGGFYSALPVHYRQTSRRYPLLLFLHGSSQTGDGNADLPDVLLAGVPALLKQNVFPAHFTVNGTYYSFIVLIPQFNELPKNESIYSFLLYAKQHFRIDTSRIYVCGLSAGGVAASDFGAEHASSVAAVVPISGVSLWFDLENKARKIAEGKLPLWAIHNENDETIRMEDVSHFIQLINLNNPTVRPKLTRLLPFGVLNHDAWTRASDPSFREEGLNIYEWMLQYSR